MEWGAERILALRKHAGMTQAQIAQWLGVTIKQVKYLEHQRRNPSGPTRRLLSILAAQLKFENSTQPLQVVGASLGKKLVAKPPPPRCQTPPPEPGSPPVSSLAVPPVLEALEATKAALSEAEQSTDDGAFAWQ